MSLRLPTSLSTISLAALAIGLACSLGAIHCYLLTRRKLSEAGIRGTIFGVLLLILSLGLFSGLGELGTSSLLTTVSAILILVAGIICFVLRDSVASTPILIHQQLISQQT